MLSSGEERGGGVCKLCAAWQDNTSSNDKGGSRNFGTSGEFIGWRIGSGLSNVFSRKP